MLNDQKPLLRLAEFACIGGALVCFGAACFAKLMPARAARVEGLVYLALAGVFCLALLAALLLSELSRELQYRRGLRPADGALWACLFGLVRRFAPARYRQVALFGGLVVLLVPVVLGPLAWSSHEAFEAYDGVGFMLVFAGAFALLLPLFAAAARLPGAFEDHESIFGNE